MARLGDERHLGRKPRHLDVVAVDLDGHPRPGQRDPLPPSGSFIPSGSIGDNHVLP